MRAGKPARGGQARPYAEEKIDEILNKFTNE